MEFDREVFGMRIRCTRIEKRLTQQALAELVEAQSQHISRIERGLVACSIDLLMRLSHGLQVSTDYLLTGKEDRKTKEQLEEIIEALTRIAGGL